MKRIAFLSIVAMSLLLAFLLVFNPQRVIGSRGPLPAGPGIALPDSIQKLVKRACMDCHADDGNFMAKGKINFSVWDNYDTGKKVDKAQAMCKVLTKGSMPQKKWCANNPKDVPTQAEKEMVCKWANSLKK